MACPMKAGPPARTVGILALVALGLTLFAAVGAWRLATLYSRVTATHAPPPRHALPKPNGYDDFVAATRLLVDEKKLNIPSKGSAYGSTASIAQKRASAVANRAALARLRAGFTYDYMEPPLPPTFDYHTPHYAPYRQLARQLAVEADLKAAAGDWSGALQSRIDAIRLGMEVPKGAIMIGMLVGRACTAIGVNRAWPLVDRLNANQALQAAAELAEIQTHRQPFVKTLDEEERWAEATVRKFIDQTLDPVAQRAKDSVSGRSPATEKAPRFGGEAALLLHWDLSSYTHAMDRYRARAMMPFANPAPIPTNTPDWGRTLTKILTPNFRVAWVYSLDEKVQVDLLTITLALHAYRLKAGRYPGTLEALQPEYLSRLPLDPFAIRSGYRYRLTSGNPLLYSVGPDKKDDGGRAIINPKKSKERDRHFVRAESIGDIVAGVNP